MSKTGDYRWKFTWLQCSRSLNTDTGDTPRTYAENGTLWGSIVLDSATEVVEQGSERTQASGTIRLRGWIAISELDRIKHNRFNEVYKIDGVRRDTANYETILDIHRYDQDEA